MNRDGTLFFTRGGCASCLRACFRARLLPQSYQYPNLSEGADRVGGQLRGDKECPFSGVTKSGRFWRKVPESDAGCNNNLPSVENRVITGSPARGRSEYSHAHMLISRRREKASLNGKHGGSIFVFSGNNDTDKSPTQSSHLMACFYQRAIAYTS